MLEALIAAPWPGRQSVHIFMYAVGAVFVLGFLYVFTREACRAWNQRHIDR